MRSTAQSQVVLAGPEGEPLIRKTPDVCGGDACIRETRIMVWLLMAFKRQGMTDAELVENYPGLTDDDLAAAWEYARLHPAEIEETIRESARGLPLSQQKVFTSPVRDVENTP